MELSDLPDEALTWAEYGRICLHPLFARSANHQALLRYLLQRRYAGSTDFSGKTIAFELFGRDTTIAKVEGRTLRKKLSDYYDGAGRNDAVVIRIPPRTFEPIICLAIQPLDYPQEDAYDDAIKDVVYPYGAGLIWALSDINEALSYAPRHPHLLSAKALLHVLAPFYGESPVDQFDMAEYIVREITAMNVVTSEAVSAKACLEASRCKWESAEALFDEAKTIPPSKGWFLGLCDWWHVFLVAQGRSDESLEIRNGSLRGRNPMESSLYARCALVNIVAGNTGEAQAALDRGYQNCGDYILDTERFAFCQAFLEGSRANYTTAVELLSNLKSNRPDVMLGTAVSGLIPLYIGQGGDRQKAKDIYDAMLAHRRSIRSAGLRDPTAFQIALAAVGADDPDGAVRWLMKAHVQERDPLVLWAHVWPFLRPLHRHHGFQDLITKTLHLSL